MQGGIDSILQPEILTPSQYYDSHSGARSNDPIGRLMLAVLTDAVVSFQKNAGSTGRRGARLFAEVENWFFTEGDDDPFAFESICDTLKIDFRALRAGLKAWGVCGAPEIHISRRSLVRHNGKITARTRRRGRTAQLGGRGFAERPL